MGDRNINTILNHDCLLYIFEKLELIDLLSVELVCKTWNEIGILARSKIKTLDVAAILSPNSSAKIKPDFIMNISKEKGSYFNKLVLTIDLRSINCNVFITELTENCKNISELVLRGSGHNSMFNHETFCDHLFSQMQNFNSLSLIDLQIDGYCLLKLPSDNIKKLIISRCEIFNDGHFATFLKNLKNLKEITIHVQSKSKKKYMIFNLLDGLKDCENIIFIDLSVNEETILVDNLLSFLEKQKKLSRIKLKNISIPVKKFEIFTEYPHFENLVTFSYEIDQLIFLEFEVFVKFFNTSLKEINIIFNVFERLGTDKIDFHEDLQNLETLTIDFKRESKEFYSSMPWLHNFYVDRLLKQLQNCKNFKNLSISDCNFRSKAFSFITNLINLETLSVKSIQNGVYHLQKENLELLFKNASNLRNITLENYFGITSDLINKISKIKTERGDKHILKIMTNYEIKCKSHNKTNEKQSKFSQLVYHYHL